MTENPKPVLSEDPNAGLAAPIMDLMAAGVIAVIALWMLAESLRLSVPGAITTAPGLLPFITSASLLIMAVILGANALVRRRVADAKSDRIELPADFRRTLFLGAILVVYLLGLQFLPVEAAITIASVRFVIGAFEVATLVVLTAILRFYWQAALWACFAVTFGWIALLSVMFRIVFQVPLP